MGGAFGLNTYEVYQTPFPNATTTLVSPGMSRIPLNLPSKFLVGDPIDVRYAFENHVIAEKDSQDLIIQSVNIYTSWCMDFATSRTKRLNIIDLNLLPRNERWMSTIVDCIHLMDTRDYISISDSTDLEFSSSQQPFTPHAKGKVISTKIYDSLSQIFTLNSSINVNINDYVVISDTPQVFINNLSIVNNRARGILLETRNVYIKNSIFNRTSGPAILFQTSLSWHEGPYPINITFTQDLYLDNNEGISKNKGVITILPDPIQFIPIIPNVQITSSTFLIGKFNQDLIQSYNENNISFHGNYINTNHSSPFLAICNTRNITAKNNTLINFIGKN